MATFIYSDLNQKYQLDSKTKDIKADLDGDAIKNSIRNILQTRKTERRMLPEFGASLEQLLFEPIDTFTARKIGSIILDEIEFWEPRVVINLVNVAADEDKGQYEINIDYSIKSANINKGNISFVLTQG